jgi:hypothetical protein
MAKQRTGGQKKGTPNKITTDVRAEGTTRAAPAAAPSAGGLGPQYFGQRTGAAGAKDAGSQNQTN